MDVDLLVGLSVMAVDLATTRAVALQGEPYETLWGVFIAELGAMFTVGSMVDEGVPRVAVIWFFAAALASTGFMYWKLRKRALLQRPPARSSGDSQNIHL